MELSKAKVVTVDSLFLEYGTECSGALISKQGDILTSALCFKKDLQSIRVILDDNKAYTATLVDKDVDIDLALVHVPELKNTPYFRLGKEVKLGEQVISIGSPIDFRRVVTVGWVAMDPQLVNVVVFLHTAFVNSGNSGGPLLNLKGQLVGINRGILRGSKEDPTQGLFTAIPLHVIRTFLSKNEIPS